MMATHYLCMRWHAPTHPHTHTSWQCGSKDIAKTTIYIIWNVIISKYSSIQRWGQRHSNSDDYYLLPWQWQWSRMMLVLQNASCCLLLWLEAPFSQILLAKIILKSNLMCRAVQAAPSSITWPEHGVYHNLRDTVNWCKLQFYVSGIHQHNYW